MIWQGNDPNDPMTGENEKSTFLSRSGKYTVSIIPKINYPVK